MVAVPSPSPKPPEWQMLVMEFSGDSGTVLTGTIMLKDNSVAGSLGHHSKFQPINVDGQSFGEEKWSCHVQIYNNVRDVAVAFNKGVRRYMNPYPMSCSWTWTRTLNVSSVLKEACSMNCSTLLPHGWYLQGSHVICDFHLCGMRAKDWSL